MMQTKLLNLLKWAGFGLLCLAVLYVILSLWSGHKLRQAYAALEKDGRPMTMAQLRSTIKGSQDAYRAALVHQSAVLLLKSKPGVVGESTCGYDDLFGYLVGASEAVLSDFPSSETAIDADRLRKWFQNPEVSKILHEVETTIEERPCCFKMFDDDGRIDFRQHYDKANLAKILCAKAKLLADDGKTSEAWSTVIHGLSLADSLKTIPFGLERSRIRVAHQGLTVIRQLAGKSLPSQKERQPLACLLSAFYDAGPLKNSLDGRRLWMEEGWWKDAKVRESSVSHFGNMRSIGFCLFSKADHAAYLDFFRQYANMAAQPYSAKKTLLMQNYPSSLPCWCVITRSDRTVDNTIRLCDEFMKFRASTAVVQAGLVVLYYRQAHGKYPQDLVEAGFFREAFEDGPPKNADPFTSAPLIYKLMEKGFRVYSVGPDLKDSGGQGTTKFRDMDRDIVWDYQAP